MVVSLVVDGLLDYEPVDEVAVREYLRVYDETQTEYPFTMKACLLLKSGQPAAALDVVDKSLARTSEAGRQAIHDASACVSRVGFTGYWG